jgi:hypothetical protein
MRLEQWWTDLGHTWGLRRQSAGLQRPSNRLDGSSPHRSQQQQARYLEPKLSLLDSELSHTARYDSHFGPSETGQHPSLNRPNCDADVRDPHDLPAQNIHGRDGQSGQAHPSKKQRLSVSIRRPYEGPHPDSFGQYLPGASAVVAAKGAQPKAHHDFAALLTAAEYRG